jgi:hypothetical protein
MTDPERFAIWFNFCEALLWISIGLVIPIYQTHRFSTRSGHTWILAFTLLGFGISDFVEIRTGAWYSPIQLLVLKAICVGIFLFYFFRYLGMRPRRIEQYSK